MTRVYNPYEQCGLCPNDTAEVIAGVGLCVEHLERIAAIARGTEPVRGQDEAIRCPCGRKFRRPKNAGRRPVWCAFCQSLSYHKRLDRAKAAQVA